MFLHLNQNCVSKLSFNEFLEKAGRVFIGQHGRRMIRITGEVPHQIESIRRRKPDLKNYVLGLDPAGPRWFPGMWEDAYPDLNNNTIR